MLIPPRRATQYVPPEHILQAHSPVVQRVAARLRQVVRVTLPDAQEVGYPGWHAIGYRQVRSGRLCAIFPFESTVQLVFEWGALLKDPDRVLQGTSRQTRYLEYSRPEDIDAQQLSVFLLEAAGLRS